MANARTRAARTVICGQLATRSPEVPQQVGGLLASQLASRRGDSRRAGSARLWLRERTSRVALPG
ncbi:MULTISPECIES: hypothetical protein [unclassified Frankia]|uniref:hypothetical protein n=1 Tax=unclassified Frankia TaxID=2632575 RepID=UPI001EF57A0D|nr:MULTISPECIES: hypothetical protein [unclassified Frankia]